MTVRPLTGAEKHALYEKKRRGRPPRNGGLSYQVAQVAQSTKREVWPIPVDKSTVDMLDKWINAQIVPPARAAVIRVALKEWIDRRNKIDALVKMRKESMKE